MHIGTVYAALQVPPGHPDWGCMERGAGGRTNSAPACPRSSSPHREFIPARASRAAGPCRFAADGALVRPCKRAAPAHRLLTDLTAAQQPPQRASGAHQHRSSTGGCTRQVRAPPAEPAGGA